MITDVAALQSGFGAQYTGGANQRYINNLEDTKDVNIKIFKL